MTRHLILMRHAKSDWGSNAAGDHDRPLNPRGRAAALAIGRWCAAAGHVPDLVLCSTARRTVETWQAMAPSFDPAPELTHQQSLYHAEPAQMLSLLQKQSRRTIMLLGHNPGIGDLAQSLLARPPDDPAFAQYPTAAVTVMAFGCASWADVGPGRGQLMAFTTPARIDARIRDGGAAPSGPGSG